MIIADEHQPNIEGTWEVFYKLGNSLLKLHRWEEASSAYRQAIILNPEIDWLYYCLGESLSKEQKWDDAVNAYKVAIKLNTELPLIHKKLAYALHMRSSSDHQVALKFFTEQIEQSPNESQNYHKAIELQPRNASFYLGLSKTLLRHGQLEQALMILQIIHQLQPNDQKIANNIGNLSQIIARHKNSTSLGQFLDRPSEPHKRILFIEDTIPHPSLGAGYGRSHSILCEMINLGFNVTLYPVNLTYLIDTWAAIQSDIPVSVEIITGYGLNGLENFLRVNHNLYDIIFVSRPHNMKCFNLAASKICFEDQISIVYDAEALYCLREISRQRVHNERLSCELEEITIREELNLAQSSHSIITVSEYERSKFIEHGYQKVSVLGHSISPSPTSNSFHDRENILFVGAVYEENSPNADSITWLCQDIFQKLKATINESVKLIIAGKNTVEYFNKADGLKNDPFIRVIGGVNNLRQLYNETRLFVAPTRFAAGLPYKIHEAAAHGLPVVTTSLIANQLGWKHKHHLLVADTVEEFACQCAELYSNEALWNHLRNNAFERIKADCAPISFANRLKKILIDETLLNQ